MIAALLLAACGARTDPPATFGGPRDAAPDPLPDAGCPYPVPGDGTPYEVGEVVEDRLLEGSGPDGTIHLADYHCDFPASRVLLVHHFVMGDDVGPAASGLVGLYEDLEPQGLRALVLATELPGGLPLDMDSARLFFAGVEFDWAVDAEGWSDDWGAPGEASLVVGLRDMAIREILPRWDADAVRAAVERVLTEDP